MSNIAKALKFESFLQSVHVPKISFGKHVRSLGSANTETVEMDESESRHIERLFYWLRDKMKVKKIFYLSVDYDGEDSHSDTAIELAVETFGVEVWDWKKFDIGIDVILRACPDLEEINLYTTGNLSILRDWSSEDGLVRFRKVSLSFCPRLFTSIYTVF